MYVPIQTVVRQDLKTLSSSSTHSRNQLKLLKLHYSLGHPSEDYMRKMMRLGFLNDVISRDVRPDEMDIV